ncbi:ABC transporter ATP-binding protein [Glaciecola sp. MH2013]|uniref:ABC transporter ATP-binding protein n=1 Tax=Glaciecola sp. MH2013 TaxID=2785524 RepID=UPI0018A0031E|nr:ABC transporter ATP-binding protein [Glaciecola sp. MH2013]MBF7073476.1 ABC transporter ATP-binding protein [Glaciecola sp. MH2013]
MDKQTVFTLSNITKHYGSGDEVVKIFDGVDFTLNEGDFIALMGPSGCGKTTLLNILGGIDRPNQGEVLFKGTPIETLSQSALTDWRSQYIGFVFQAFNLLPMFSAERNVELPLLLTSLSAKERSERVKTALELMGLSECSKRLPKKLSGGQQQRVAIARALVSDASVLLCDEPTGNLDKKSSEEVLSLLQMLNHDFNKTIVMVTHDPKAATYASRTYHLDKGSFINDYSNEFDAA